MRCKPTHPFSAMFLSILSCPPPFSSAFSTLERIQHGGARLKTNEATVTSPEAIRVLSSIFNYKIIFHVLLEEILPENRILLLCKRIKMLPRLLMSSWMPTTEIKPSSGPSSNSRARHTHIPPIKTH